MKEKLRKLFIDNYPNILKSGYAAYEFDIFFDNNTGNQDRECLTDEEWYDMLYHFANKRIVEGIKSYDCRGYNLQFSLIINSITNFIKFLCDDSTSAAESAAYEVWSQLDTTTLWKIYAAVIQTPFLFADELKKLIKGTNT